MKKYLTQWPLLLTLGIALALPTLAVSQTAFQVLNGKQQYFDKSGKLVSGGRVDYYIPGTTTRKTVWQDPNKVTSQTNGVVLDMSGYPQPTGQTFGDGAYRQVLKDKDGITIWDVTTYPAGSGGGGGGGGDAGVGVPAGAVMAWAGMVAPTNWQFAYGQEVSRVTYPDLFNTITMATSVSCTSGSTTISGIADTSQIKIGSRLEASCLATTYNVVSRTSNSVTLDGPASTTTTVTGRFFAWGNGDGATTFNVPDYRGMSIVGRDNMGGVIAANITSTYFGTNPDALGAIGGNQSTTLLQTNLPNVSPVFTGTPGAVSVNSTQNDFGRDPASQAFTPGGTPFLNLLSTATVTSTGTFTPVGTISPLGSSTPFSNISPSVTTNIIIKMLNDTGGGGGSGITLTTIGTSGVATLVDNVLNIPNYSGGGGGGSGGETNPTFVSSTPYTPTNDDTFLCVNVGGPVTINLQSVAARGNLNLSIVDCSGQASANNISIVPNGTDTITGIYTNSNPLKITTDYGGWTILPIGTAWAFQPGDTSGSSAIFSLTTSGSSGPATYVGGVLNIPEYTGGGGGSGTVTNVSVATANGFAGSVANATTTPTITMSTTVTGVLKGDGTAVSAATAGTDYQSPISLTTTGSSGAATFVGNVLNIPNYATGSGDVSSNTSSSVVNEIAVFSNTSGKQIGRATGTGIATLTSGVLSATSTTGSGNVVLSNGGTMIAPILGTPASVTLTNGTGLPISGITGLGTGVGTWLGTPSSANLAAAVTDETGSGALVFGTNPAISGPTVTGGSINNTPIGAGTRSTGAFTTLAANGAVTLSGIPGSGTIASSICATSGGALIAQAGANCYAGGSAAAGGNNTNVQYNSSGVLAGSDNWVFNGTDTMSIGASGSVVGKVEFFNATSGSVILQADTGALGSTVLTLPAGSTTLIGAGTTATFTNKTFDTAGTGNSFLINGVAATANTGTGAIARAVSPSFTTPTLGVATATTINKVTFTAPATGSALTIADGKTLTASNSITLAGTDGITWTGPSSNATLAALNIASQTVTGGANVTSQSISTGSYTVDCGTRPLQYITNGGAFTLTAPANDGNCVLLVTNNGSAGAITFSGFSVGSNTGDALTTTNTSKFSIMVWRVNGTAAYQVVAHQ